MAPPRGALVLGADYRALGVARSLGRRGIPVWTLAEPEEPLAQTSRYSRRSLRWPCSDPGRRLAVLARLAVENGIEGWALIPSSDSAAALIARGYDELEQYYTHTIPPWGVVRWAYDKRLTYELAERVGVASPRTMLAAQLSNGFASGVSFPVVLKPAIKEAFNALTSAKAWRVDDRQELERRLQEARELIDSDALLLQELIGGRGESQFSYAALCRDGVPLASVTARRTRQYPAEFGRASTFVETVDCQELVDPSVRLLREMRYTGLIEIEYKRDQRDGVFKLLDMNPRVWGWHSLCPRAGVDFPWLLWLLVCDRDVPVPPRSRGRGMAPAHHRHANGDARAPGPPAAPQRLRAFPHASAEGSDICLGRPSAGPCRAAGARLRARASAVARKGGVAVVTLDLSDATILELDDARWRSFIAETDEATPFHDPAWAALLARTYGYSAFAVAITGDDGRVAAGAPFLEVRGISRRRHWISLPFTDECPLLAEDADSRRRLISALGASQRQVGAPGLEVRGSVDELGWRVAADAVIHELRIDADLERVRRRFSRSQVIRNIARAEREGVVVRRAVGASDLNAFYELHTRTRRRQGIPVQPRRFFDLIWSDLVEAGLAFVLLADAGGRAAVAGALFLTGGGNTIYKFGASDVDSWRLRPNHLIFWTAIQDACERRDHRFDFGRTDLDNDGLRAFKSGWGAEERPLRYSTLGGFAGAHGLASRALGLRYPEGSGVGLPGSGRGAISLRRVTLDRTEHDSELLPSYPSATLASRTPHPHPRDTVIFLFSARSAGRSGD